MCFVLTLKSLNQELANTGRARQQNVMPNAPGQGYWDAAVSINKPENQTEGVDYKEFYGRYILADKNKQQNNPCCYVVFKAFGMCALSNIAFWGRRIRKDSSYTDFGTPGWIFPMNFNNASTYTLHRTQNEQSNYYWVRNLAPFIQFDLDAMTALKQTLSMKQFWTTEGFVQINGGDVAAMKATNPKNDGKFTNQLFGRMYFDKGKKYFLPWKITNEKFGTKGFKTDMIYGCKQYYDDSGEKFIHDAMFHAFWKQKNMKTLPIGEQNTLDFGWTLSTAISMAKSDMIMGGALLIGVGISAAMVQNMSAPVFQGFSCLVPATIMDFMVQECTSIFGNNYTGKVKLSYFTSEEDNDIVKLFNTDTLNTSFEAELTNMFTYKDKKGGFHVFGTPFIGQNKDSSDRDILPDGEAVLLGGQEKLTSIVEIDSNVGFIIDAIHIQGLFKGEFSIEFLDSQKTVIWSGTYQSQGKWADSIREINTWINTSIYGRENMFLAQKLPWPKRPVELDIDGNTGLNISYEWSVLDMGRILKWERGYNQSKELKHILADWGFEFNMNWNGWAHFTNKDIDVVFFERTVDIKGNYNQTIEDFYNEYTKVSIDFSFFNVEGFEITTKRETLRMFYNPNTQKVGAAYGIKQKVDNGKIWMDNLYAYKIPYPVSPETIDHYETQGTIWEEHDWAVVVNFFKEGSTIKATITILMPNIKYSGYFTGGKLGSIPDFENLGGYKDYEINKPGSWDTQNKLLFYTERGAPRDKNVAWHLGAYVSRIEVISAASPPPPNPNP